MSEKQRIEATVKRIVKMLAAGEYGEIESLTNGRRLTAEEMSEAVSEYGGSLVMPDEAFYNLDIIEIAGSNPKRWSVNINLPTAGEGQSDLTLELTLTENGKEILDIEVDNIHTL